jgi:hypothetical protein
MLPMTAFVRWDLAIGAWGNVYGPHAETMCIQSDYNHMRDGKTERCLVFPEST